MKENKDIVEIVHGLINSENFRKWYPMYYWNYKKVKTEEEIKKDLKNLIEKGTVI